MEATDPVHAECKDAGCGCLKDDVRKDRGAMHQGAGDSPSGQQYGKQNGKRRDSVGDLGQHGCACRDSGVGIIGLVLVTRPVAGFLSTLTDVCKPWHDAFFKRNVNPRSATHRRDNRGGLTTGDRGTSSLLSQPDSGG